MNKVIYCPDQLPLKDDVWVFLMGPIQGAEFWHKTIEDMPEISGVTFLSPRRKDNPIGNEDSTKIFSDEDYKEQVKWETILEKYKVYVVHRQGESIDDVPEDLLKKYKSIEIIPGELVKVPISSTQIRDAIQSGLDEEVDKIRPWVHPEALKYIYSHKLYHMPFYDLPPNK